MSLNRWVAKQLRAYANWLDPPRNELYVTVKFDASEFLDGLDSIKRRLKGPSINGEIP